MRLGFFIMNRIIFFIDGFNLYHSLNDNPIHHKYKWLDLHKLCECFIKKEDAIQDIYYFTALAKWLPEKVKRHQNYIKALFLKNIKIIYGEFKVKDRRCQAQCGQIYRSHEEKQSDVNIIANLFKLAYEDKYDTGIVISGDSDLTAGIRTVQSTFPAKKIGIISPFGRSSKQLKQIADFHMKIKEKHLSSSVFPLQIDLGGNKYLICPSTWQ